MPGGEPQPRKGRNVYSKRHGKEIKPQRSGMFGPESFNQPRMASRTCRAAGAWHLHSYPRCYTHFALNGAGTWRTPGRSADFVPGEEAFANERRIAIAFRWGWPYKSQSLNLLTSHG